MPKAIEPTMASLSSLIKGGHDHLHRTYKNGKNVGFQLFIARKQHKSRFTAPKPNHCDAGTAGVCGCEGALATTSLYPTLFSTEDSRWILGCLSILKSTQQA